MTFLNSSVVPMHLLLDLDSIESDMKKAIEEQKKYVILTFALGEKTTDTALSSLLEKATPLSFRKAQDLLVATERLIKKKGFFTSDEKRLLNVATEYAGLLHALKFDGTFQDDFEKNEDIYVVFKYLNFFSYTFPNWQNEYLILEHLIPQFYSMQK